MKNILIAITAAASFVACSHAPTSSNFAQHTDKAATVERSVAGSTDLNDRLFQSVNEYRRTYSYPEISRDQFQKNLVSNAEACTVINGCEPTTAEPAARAFRRIVKRRIPSANVQKNDFIDTVRAGSLTDLSNYLSSNVEK